MNDLIKLLRNLPDPAQLETFMEVFLTEHERNMLMERLEIFRSLAAGATQRQVAAQLGCSVVTVTRGAKVFRQHREIVNSWLRLIPPSPHAAAYL